MRIFDACLSSASDCWRGWVPKRMVLAHRWVAPRCMAAKMPRSVSGKHQPSSTSGNGFFDSVITLRPSCFST